MFDIRPPLNINDSDISPQMTNTPAEREGYTEMTFCLIRYEAMKAGWKVGYASPTRSSGADIALGDREAVVKDLKDRLEHHYLPYCDKSIPFALFASTVARVMITRTWLVVHYPSKQKEGCTSTMSQASRDQLFSTSMEILEHSCTILTENSISKWTWPSKTHIQWHAVIFVLFEICSRPSSPDRDRAWEFVNTVHNRWNMRDSGKRDNLWRPIQRLMAKARYVREMQQLDPGFHLVVKTAAPGIMPPPVIMQHNLPDLFGTSGATGSEEYMDWMLGDLGIDICGGMMDKPSWG
ncbi:hypothetical protein LZL87_012968 [Fusarium oxysporum]|nr:hypothetical protein LZL87_012968 [Fusarium oxysporum]